MTCVACMDSEGYFVRENGRKVYLVIPSLWLHFLLSHRISMNRELVVCEALYVCPPCCLSAVVLSHSALGLPSWLLNLSCYYVVRSPLLPQLFYWTLARMNAGEVYTAHKTSQTCCKLEMMCVFTLQYALGLLVCTGSYLRPRTI